MKAIFILDACEDEMGKAVATITANGITFFARGIITPLPQMRESNEEWLNEYHRDEFADGWNACLKEITGEVEWMKKE